MADFSLKSYTDCDGFVDWDAALNAVLQQFGCMTGTIHRVSADDGQLHMVSYAGIPEHVLPMVMRIPIGKGIAGAAAERREPVEICNLQVDDGGVAKPAAKDTKVSGSVAVPVELEDGTLVGTLGIGKVEPYEFTDREKSALAGIASLISAEL